MRRVREFFTPETIATILLMMIVVVSAVVHGSNMLHYPYFENDEGTYFTRAWTFLYQGKLDAYTYWYDHSPFGWMFASLWMLVTGGPFRFGFSLNSARVFTFLLHIASTWLLFKTTRKLTQSAVAATLACVFFALSPLAVYFQRRFLLDNVMVFWILLSLYLILFSRQRLSFYIMSAIAFGIAALSKENGVFFGPVLVYFTATTSHRNNRLFAIATWIAIGGIIISFYPVYALLKGELFATGSVLSAPGDHVSLLGTLAMQSSRGAQLPFWNYHSDFMVNFRYWLHTEPFFIITGFSCLIIQGVAAIFSKRSRDVFLLTLSILLFFISGKLVINFYVIALIPFLGMAAGLTLTQLLQPLSRINMAVYVVMSFAIIAAVVGYYAGDPDFQVMLTRDDTKYQLQAVDWIRNHIDPKAYIATDYYANLDLTVKNPAFVNADWYWKLDFDRDIRDKKLHNDFRMIQYVMLTNQMFRDLNGFNPKTSLLRNALNNSSIVQLFAPEDASAFSMPQYPSSHANGDWVALMKQNNPAAVVNQTWKSFAESLVQSNGLTATATNGDMDARTQAYTMLRAALANDQTTFDRSYAWTRDHLILPDKHLLATTYNTESDKVTNPGTTTDADEDMAFALAVAARKWRTPEYQTAAKAMIGDIWKYETKTIGQARIIIAGDWANQTDGNAIVSPASLEPYAYRLFADLDPGHDWNSLITTAYDTLESCTEATPDTVGSAHLPPNWCAVNTKGEVVSAKAVDAHAGDYSYDAPRTLWRISADYYWNREPRARAYLQKMTVFAQDWSRHSSIAAAYTHDGHRVSDVESLAQYGNQVALFAILDPKTAEHLYYTKIAPSITSDGTHTYWGDRSNIYDQTWVWLGVSLFDGTLSKP